MGPRSCKPSRGPLELEQRSTDSDTWLSVHCAQDDDDDDDADFQLAIKRSMQDADAMAAEAGSRLQEGVTRTGGARCGDALEGFVADDEDVVITVETDEPFDLATWRQVSSTPGFAVRGQH